MLFNQKEFEHTINEVSLQKGLKLFHAHKVELINSTENNNRKFLINERIPGELAIQIRAGNIIHYFCFCNSSIYCEHLAAALFYLQKAELNFLNTKQENNKRSGISKIKKKWITRKSNQRC